MMILFYCKHNKGCEYFHIENNEFRDCDTMILEYK